MDSKRIRSPNYPALSLKQAVERAVLLYRNQHRHPAPREVVAKSLGFGALSGPASTVISSLSKYGLLERDGAESKISERALQILHPHSEQERNAALRAAASEPQLFAELNERFPGELPSDELLRNYLMRKNFSPSAVSGVIRAYKETLEFVEHEASAYDSPADLPDAEQTMPDVQNQNVSRFAPAPTPPPRMTPVISIMEDRLVVNATVRSRAKADALIAMLNTVKALLPPDDPDESAEAAPSTSDAA